LTTVSAISRKAYSPTPAQIIVIASITCPLNCLYSLVVYCKSYPIKIFIVSLKNGMNASFACSTVDAKAVTAFSLTSEMPFYTKSNNFFEISKSWA